MPYTGSRKDEYTPREPLPDHLEHRPVYAIPYEHFDGMWAGRTDARYISVGLAQWDPDEVSVKTMRHTGRKWSRQAEELPLHRAIDMTTFLSIAIFKVGDGEITVGAGTFEKQKEDIVITAEKRRYGEMASYSAFLEKHRELLKARLRVLAGVLDDLRGSGTI